MPETRDIIFAPSDKEGPAALPGSLAPAAPCQDGTAASLHLRRELRFIYSFALQIYHSISLCPRSQQAQPSCSPARGPTLTPATLSLPSEPKEPVPGDKH